jgi:hypothetical protein
VKSVDVVAIRRLVVVSTPSATSVNGTSPR